jgi:hypothetical protein
MDEEDNNEMHRDDNTEMYRDVDWVSLKNTKKKYYVFFNKNGQPIIGW